MTETPKPPGKKLSALALRREFSPLHNGDSRLGLARYFSDIPDAQTLPRRTLQMLTTAAGARFGMFIPDEGAPMQYGSAISAKDDHLAKPIIEQLSHTAPTGNGLQEFTYQKPDEKPETLFAYGVRVSSTDTINGEAHTKNGTLWFLKPNTPAEYRKNPSRENITPANLFAGPFNPAHLNVLDYYLHPQDFITNHNMRVDGPVLDVAKPLLFPRTAEQQIHSDSREVESMNFLKGLRACVHKALGTDEEGIHPETQHHQMQVTRFMQDFMEAIRSLKFANEFPENAELRKLLPKEAFSKHFQERLEMASDLHDMGKIYVPLEVLAYSGDYPPLLRRTMNAHPIISTRLLAPIDPLCTLLSGTHHMFSEAMTMSETKARVVQERRRHEELVKEGKKPPRPKLIPYPFYMKADQFELPPIAKMMSICDKADALWTCRAYQTGTPGGRDKTPPERVAHILVLCAMDGEIDAGLTKLFLQARKHIKYNDFATPVEQNIDSNIAAILDPEKADEKDQALYRRFNEKADAQLEVMKESLRASGRKR